MPGMGKIRHFRAADIEMESFGGPPGIAMIARLIGPEISTSMGAGLATFDDCSIEWTVLYDEVIVVLEGRFRLRTGVNFEESVEAAPGDVIWLPENTPVKYEGDSARIFYAPLSRRLEKAPYPLIWNSGHGLIVSSKPLEYCRKPA
jgi:ethanolamine utilization protein EutQ